ncbi:AAA family ATPase [Brachybacterium sp. NPDC056505]|uniref:AAA family ATPase n=1 Tax=Brachybacterium sp. NPDC056505 TaxID=3345843 RepID=UPI0036704D87
MAAEHATAPAPERGSRGSRRDDPVAQFDSTSSSDRGREFAVVTAAGPDGIWEPTTITFDDYAEKAKHPADHKACGAVMCGTLTGDRKRRTDVLTRTMATLDVDQAEAGLIDAVRTLGVQTLVHSTYRHTTEAPRYRLVMPYSREVTPGEHVHVSRVLMHELGHEQFDPRSAYPEQCMFWPSTSDPEQYVVKVFDGPLLDPDQYLGCELPAERPREPAARPSAAVAAPASPRPRAYAQGGVSRAFGELQELVSLTERARDHKGRGWEENGGLHAHACSLVELSNLDPAGHPLDEIGRRFVGAAPAGEEGRFQHHWDDAVQHVGDRPAELPDDHSGLQIEVIDDRTDGAKPELTHVDLSALLSGGKLPEPPRPSILRRTDESPLFYSGRVNRLFGDPESGKSWVLLAAAAEVLEDGGTVAHLDLDHMDRAELVQRLAMLGTPLTVLGDPSRFRLYQPGDGADLSRAVAEVVSWNPDLVGLDSLGEVLPMLGLSSNSPDDYTAAHRRVVQPLADAGSAVVIIDHLAKSTDSRVKGPGGTLAKGRPIRGVSLRVSMLRLFSPGHGGACRLTIDKDTAGGVRASCPPKGRSAEQQAGVFTLTQQSDGSLDWYVEAPRAEGDPMPELVDEAALQAVSQALEQSQEALSQRKVATAAEVRPARVPELLEQLERGGYVRRFSRGQGRMAESIKPYRAGDPLPMADGEADG